MDVSKLVADKEETAVSAETRRGYLHTPVPLALAENPRFGVGTGPFHQSEDPSLKGRTEAATTRTLLNQSNNCAVSARDMAFTTHAGHERKHPENQLK